MKPLNRDISDINWLPMVIIILIHRLPLLIAQFLVSKFDDYTLQPPHILKRGHEVEIPIRRTRFQILDLCLPLNTHFSFWNAFI